MVWLVDRGTMDRKYCHGLSTLMFSVDRVRRVFRLLLYLGADPMILSCDGQRAADIADRRGKCVMQAI